MSWGKVDDKLHCHPKVDDAGVEAMGLWVLALSYCAAQLTDGFVTVERVRKIAGKRGLTLAAKLVASRFWYAVPQEDGYQFHDWKTYQPTRAKVLAEREAAVRRMSAARSPSVRPNEQRTSDAVTPSVRLPRPVPSRPDPVPNQETPDSDGWGVSDEPQTQREPRPPPKPRQPVRPDGETGFAMFTRVFVELWEAKYKSRFVHTTHIGPGGDDMIFQRLGHAALEQPNPEAWVRHMVRSYLRDVDRWVVENNHPIVGLEKRVNKYGEPKGPPRSGVQVVGSQVRQEQPPPVLLDMKELGRRAEALAKAGKATG